VLKSACIAFEFPELFCPRTLGQLVGVSAKTVRKHVERFKQSLEASVAEGNRSKLERTMKDCLQDAPRAGRPPDFSPLQIVSIISIACEKPEASGRPISKWTSREIAEEAFAKPDQEDKEETQYTRHGTVCLTAAWHAVLGQVIHHTIEQTRNNDDFADFIEGKLRGDPDGKWVIVVDNRNTHSSEALVRLVARLEGLGEATLGNKKKRKGIVGSMKSRKQFLSDPTHRIRFVFTSEHSSWLNQIEVIFGIIKRRGLAGASFPSREELIERLNRFIHYFNTTFARPMNWTYTGRPTENETMDQPLTWRQRLKPESWRDHWNEFQQMLAA